MSCSEISTVECTCKILIALKDIWIFIHNGWENTQIKWVSDIKIIRISHMHCADVRVWQIDKLLFYCSVGPGVIVNQIGSTTLWTRRSPCAAKVTKVQRWGSAGHSPYYTRVWKRTANSAFQLIIDITSWDSIRRRTRYSSSWRTRKLTKILGLAKLKDGTKKDGADDNSRWVYRY